MGRPKSGKKWNAEGIPANDPLAKMANLAQKVCRVQPWWAAAGMLRQIEKYRSPIHAKQQKKLDEIERMIELANERALKGIK